jgi:hypothetical protein
MNDMRTLTPLICFLSLADPLAYKASSYLEQLLDKGAIVPQDSPELNAIYAKHAPPAPAGEKEGEDTDSDASSTSTSTGSDEHLLLTRAAVPEITAFFNVRPGSSLAADLYRAMEQAALRLQTSKESGSRSS